MSENEDLGTDETAGRDILARQELMLRHHSSLALSHAAGAAIAADPEAATLNDIGNALEALEVAVGPVTTAFQLLAGRSMAAAVMGVPPEVITAADALRAVTHPASFSSASDAATSAAMLRAGWLALLPQLKRAGVPAKLVEAMTYALRGLELGDVVGLAAPGPKRLPGQQSRANGSPLFKASLAETLAAEVAFQETLNGFSKSRAMTAATGVSDPRLAKTRKTPPTIDFTGHTPTWKQLRELVANGESIAPGYVAKAAEIGMKVRTKKTLTEEDKAWLAERLAALAELNTRHKRNGIKGQPEFTHAAWQLRRAQGS